MKKKYTLILLISIVAIIGLSATYAVTQNETTNKTMLTVGTDHPIKVSDLTNSIQTQPYYKNYNHTTLDWLKQFNSDYVVFKTKEYAILMNSTDAAKLPSETTTGVSVTRNITCDIIENRSLGYDLINIIHVKNVEITSNDLNPMQFDQNN